MAIASTFDTPDQSDEEVVRQVLDGNTALYELLMRRHNERLYRAARAITGDDREAEDVMQQAYVNAFANLRQFSGQARFATWLTQIAVNESIARVRRRRKYEPFDGDLSASGAFMNAHSDYDPERRAQSAELRKLLEWAIDNLADGAREVFMLREVEGLSTLETAQSLGVSEDVVKTRLSRARAALRTALIERAGASVHDAFRFYRPSCDRVVEGVLTRVGAGAGFQPSGTQPGA